MELKALVKVLDDLLRPNLFKDYCPNGLQVEGKAEVKKLVAGVTASKALIELAIEQNADAILVHHGYFWRGEPPEITSTKAARIKLLMQNDISLLAYHLPLDAHPTLGNNAQLGNLFGFQGVGGMDQPIETSVGLVGRTKEPVSLHAISTMVEERLARKPLVIRASKLEKPINRVAWCTGAAPGRIEDAAKLDCDLYITGEASEQSCHLANELGVHFVAAGHHATERYGVKAVSSWLADHHGLDQVFIDLDNPV